MKKIVILGFLFLIGLSCFAQGTVAGGFSIYPDEKCKDSFILCARTASIQDSSFCYYDVFDVVNCADSKDEKTFVFQYNRDVYGSMPDEEDIRILIDGNEIKCTKIDESYEIKRFYYKCKVPAGHFRISYIIRDSGNEIGGTKNAFLKKIDESLWNVSDEYEENVYISIANDYVTLNNDTFTILGNGKKSGKTFFLKSGCVFVKIKNNRTIEIECQNFYNGCGGGSGCPTLPSIYNDDKKMHSATEYIYEFITAARIVEEKLERDYEYIDYSFNALIELFKILNKDELRLFRNAFYAKNAYVFKDESLNKYFSSALCYFPDKSVTINNIKTSEAEKILIEMIQAAENDESPEAVFKKYGYKKNDADKLFANFVNREKEPDALYLGFDSLGIVPMEYLDKNYQVIIKNFDNTDYLLKKAESEKETEYGIGNIVYPMTEGDIAICMLLDMYLMPDEYFETVMYEDIERETNSARDFWHYIHESKENRLEIIHRIKNYSKTSSIEK